MSKSVLFWYWRISRNARMPGRARGLRRALSLSAGRDTKRPRRLLVGGRFLLRAMPEGCQGAQMRRCAEPCRGLGAQDMSGMPLDAAGAPAGRAGRRATGVRNGGTAPRAESARRGPTKSKGKIGVERLWVLVGSDSEVPPPGQSHSPVRASHFVSCSSGCRLA